MNWKKAHKLLHPKSVEQTSSAKAAQCGHPRDADYALPHVCVAAAYAGRCKSPWDPPSFVAGSSRRLKLATAVVSESTRDAPRYYAQYADKTS